MSRVASRTALRQHALASLLLFAIPGIAFSAPKTWRVPVPDSAGVVALLAGVQNAACPLAGVATGGQPSAANLGALARAGFTKVLDLRTSEEARGFDEPAAMHAAKLRYVPIPVTPASLTDSTFSAFILAMNHAGGKRVFVHCASGNRVGALMIPWLVLERDWDIERAVATAKAGGLKSPELETMARQYVAHRRAAR